MATDLISRTGAVERYSEFLGAMDQWKDELQIRLAKTFGLTHRPEIKKDKDGIKHVVQGEPFPDGFLYRRFDTLQQAYVEFSGDANINWWGKNVRVTQVVGLPSCEQALANVLNMMLMDDYMPTDYRWRDIVTSITAPRDFRENLRTRLQYVPDLPILSEDDPFLELLPSPSDNSSLGYNVNELGAFVSFTRRVLINDEIGLIQRAIEQVRRAAWRTLARRVWNLILSDAIYQIDDLPLFHANHNNVSTSALSAAALTSARNAMFAQKEPGGTDRLGLGKGPLLLSVPIELEATAMQLNHAPWLSLNTSGAVGTPTLNEWVHRFGINNENIFANPFQTDTNDWYLFQIGKEAQIIEVGFLQGNQAPQIEQSFDYTDQEFLQDRTVFKIRHEYEAVVLDYRACQAAIVA